jgi:hypothetical protein
MAILNGFKGSAVAGLAIGIGAALIGPAMVPVLRTLVKPTAKAAMKAGILAYEQGRVALAEFSEVADDLLAEARAELAAEHEDLAQTEPAASSPRAPAPSTAPVQSAETLLPSPG